MGRCYPRANALARSRAICCKLKNEIRLGRERRHAYISIRVCIEELRMNEAEAPCEVACHCRVFQRPYLVRKGEWIGEQQK